MNIDLEHFCATGPECRNIEKPFGFGEFTYATDGKLMIRVPGRCESNSQAPSNSAANMFIGFKSNLPWIDVPEIPPPQLQDKECPCCGHVEKVEHDEPVGMLVQNQLISKAYLRKIKSLPGVKIQIQKGDFNPVKIKFNGGIGLLMPMRKD